MHKGFAGLVRGLGDLLQAGNGIFDVSVRIGHGPVTSRIGSLPRRPGKAAQDVRDAVADVFDEDDYYLVVAEFPGAAEADVLWNIRNDNVVVMRATVDGRPYAKEVVLAARVDAQTAIARFGNGVLELRVWKQQPR